MSDKLWAFIGDNLISLATVIGGLLVLVLSMLGIVNTSIILQATLGLLILLATSETVERRRRLDAIYRNVQQISAQQSAGQQTEVKVFKDVDEHYRFLAERIALARTCIDIANFRPQLPRNSASR